MSDQIKSASVTIKPIDSRCRYWAKIIRANTSLPLPSDVDGANDITGHYLRNGEDEMFEGDILIEGEANHHRSNRGWSYWVGFCGADGKVVRIKNPGADLKAKMKAAGCPVELLAGSGQIAAAIRIAHGVRLGMISDTDLGN